MTPFYKRLPMVKIPAAGIVRSADKTGKIILGTAAAAIGVHAAVGIGKRIIKGKDYDSRQ
jgi:hydrogenase small subunit/[NiFe] hydrogenase small subunit